ncbi:MAG: HNH endonuclease signature motif containing protein [Blastocatellia bacterium]
MSNRKTPTFADYPVTVDAEGRNLCRFCKGIIPKHRRTICSDECNESLLMATNWNYARRLVEQRDKGVCAKCGCDTGYLRKFLQKHIADWPQRRKSKRNEKGFYEIADAYDDLLRQMGFNTHNYDLWEADHIVEVVRGGTNDLTNIQTLCHPCHKEKTRLLAKERAQERRDNKRTLFTSVP